MATKKKKATAKTKKTAAKKTTKKKGATKKASPVKKKVLAKKKVTKTAAKKIAPVKKHSTHLKAAKKKSTLNAESRYRIIQETAYFLAEANGFANDPSSYWIDAEARINAQLS